MWDFKFQMPERDMLQIRADTYGKIFKSIGSEIYGEFDNGVTIEKQCEITESINFFKFEKM